MSALYPVGLFIDGLWPAPLFPRPAVIELGATLEGMGTLSANLTTVGTFELSATLAGTGRLFAFLRVGEWTIQPEAGGQWVDQGNGSSGWVRR